MRMLTLWALGGCGFIGGSARDARWDVDGDGVSRPDDCDDRDPLVFPGGQERCDAADVDEDCDGMVDDADDSAIGQLIWCRDADGDGLGLATDTVSRCDAPEGYVADCTDCDDAGGPCPTTTTSPCGAPPVAALSVSPSAGEQGITSFVADASDSLAADATFTFDWGAGPGIPLAVPQDARTLEALGLVRVHLLVTDACGQSGAAEAWVAVAAPGSLLWVTTHLDEADAESVPPVPLGAGLSLREALAVAQVAPGPQVIALTAGLPPVRTGPGLPALSDPDGWLVGNGTVDGGGGGRLDVTGGGAGVVNLTFMDFTDGTYGALRLAAGGVLLQGVTVRDSAMGVTVQTDSVTLRDATLLRNGNPQVALDGAATLFGVVVADGSGVGVEVSEGGSDSTLALCQVYGQGGAGVTLARNTNRVSIIDSTIVGNGGDGVDIDPSKVDDLDLRNMVIAFNDGFGLSRAPKSYRGGAPDAVVIFGNASGACNCTFDAGVQTNADPLFADWMDGDFTPTASSPLVDAGTTATGVDRNGPAAGLTWDGAPDIGAIELR